MDNTISYSEFEVLFGELSKRLEDYYGEGTFMGFKVRMDSFLTNFKSEYFKNLASLNRENKVSYIAHLNNEIERFKEAFDSGDKRYMDILRKYQITKENLFNHTQTSNELYRILTTELSAMKKLYKNNSTVITTYDDIVDILRIFYKQYSYKFTETIHGIVNGLTAAKSGETPVIAETKKDNNSFGFPKTSEDLLKTIYLNLILDSGDFINKDQTSMDDFIGVLRAKDYRDVAAEIHFACETTQVTYIITAMQKYSRDFTFKKISNSKKFYSQRGAVITESNLSKSKSKAPNPKQFEYIDSFFAKLILKQ